MTSTFDVKITKVSDTSVSHNFMLLRDDEGAPQLRIGSREKEAARAGERGIVSIESLHHGSGQHVARDPMMYEFADGMFADEPGLVRNRGQVVANQLDTTVPVSVWSRCATLSTFSTGQIYITPKSVYYANGTILMNSLANSYFTGSYAFLGDNVFLGQRTDDNWHTSTWAGKISGGGSASNNAGFKAGFLAASAEKMWRVNQDPSNATMALSWSDDVDNATPVFSTDFDYASGRFFGVDLGIIGGHAILAVADPFRDSGKVMSVDTGGQFTELLSDIARPSRLTPFLGGRLLWLTGRPRALWMQDVDAYRELDFLAPLSRSDVRIVKPFLSADETLLAAGPTVKDNDIWIPLYGNWTKRDGSSVEGTVLVKATLRSDGLHAHVVLTPESDSNLVKGHLAGGQVGSIAAYDWADDQRIRYALLAYTTNNKSVTVSRWEMDVPTVGNSPLAWDTGTKFLRSSRYATRSRTTAQWETLRGYITALPDNNSVTVRVYLDGSSTETTNFSVSTTGPFSQALPTNCIGRDIALDFETAANGSVVIEFPWSIDYFAVPDQKDVVRLPVLAGRTTPTRVGVPQNLTRASLLETISDICAAPEAWTLEWLSDGTPNWTVVPLGYETNEREGDPTPGAGEAVAWLVLQRL